MQRIEREEEKELDEEFDGLKRSQDLYAELENRFGIEVASFDYVIGHNT